MLRVCRCGRRRTALGVLHLYVFPLVAFTVLGGHNSWTAVPAVEHAVAKGQVFV